MSTEEANQSRLVTKTRWIVEARNGHIKTIFKFLNQTISISHVPNLSDFYRIAGAIINRYHPLIHMERTNAALAAELLERAKAPNVVMTLVEEDNLGRRGGQWVQLDEQQVLDFSQLEMDFLRDLTVGIYQVNLAHSYIQDKMQREGGEEQG